MTFQTGVAGLSSVDRVDAVLLQRMSYLEMPMVSTLLSLRVTTLLESYSEKKKVNARFIITLPESIIDDLKSSMPVNPGS